MSPLQRAFGYSGCLERLGALWLMECSLRRAAERFDVSVPTPARCSRDYRELGEGWRTAEAAR